MTLPKIVKKDLSLDGLSEEAKEALNGNDKAQFCLGVMYNKGDGVPKDHAEAAKWFRKSAEQGNAEAQMSLGEMYAKGNGVQENDSKAFEWYRKAAEQGNANAQHKLGDSYFKGDGVPKDLVQAHMWWNIAAAKGNKVAKKMLATIEKQMSDSQKEKAMDWAREMFARLKRSRREREPVG